MRVISRSVLPLRILSAVTPIITLLVLFSLTPLAGLAQEEQPFQVSLDLSGDGVIDPSDLYIFTTLWKTSEPAADFNSDGSVDSFDLLLFGEAYHSSIAAPTPTPTPEESEDTPTPTPLEGEATPTPTPLEGEDTPTPTPLESEDTPTPTPLEGEATPTPTLEVILPTPTPTLGEEEPTPTPTPEEAGTPTPTPTEGPTPTPTEGPTPTPTIDPNATPTPTPPGLFFYTNLDMIESFEEAGLSALYSKESEDLLILEDRMPETNRLISWILLNTDELIPGFDYGVAFSHPKSAAVNEDHFLYNSAQTSVLELRNPIDTSQAQEPMLSFEAAFIFENPETYIADFLVVEASRADSENWEIVDINSDGEIITDKTAFNSSDPQALLPNTFDGLFGASNPDNTLGPLTQADFIPIEVNLPADPMLRIAFRFESDSGLEEEGIYLDNIRIYDAAAGGGVAPEIRRIYNQDGSDIYVDTENRVVIQGSRLAPVAKVLFTSRDGEQELAFEEISEGLAATLPRLSNPNQDDAASIQVVREDEAETAPFAFTMKAAPAPVIESISPAPFYLASASTTITITGNHFRPVFQGATEDDGSSVIIDVGAEEPIVYQLPADFLSRSIAEIVIDATALTALNPGQAAITVKNGYSGLESNSVDLTLAAGDGGLFVSEFLIELPGLFDLIDPAVDSYALYQDQIFTLIWELQGVVTDQLNIDLAGVPYVVNGQVNYEIISTRLEELGRENESLEGKIDLYASSNGVTLSFAPMIVGATGSITTSIRLGNGAPAEHSFALLDPIPPILYEREGDWASESYSTSGDIDFRVYGDNFRGQFSFYNTDAESIPLLQLIPLDGTDPITLPVMTQFDVSINPGVGEGLEDLFDQEIPTDFYNFDEGQRLKVPEGETKEFMLRVINPDSGLYVDSAARTIRFTP
ncbi:MAG: IPT/TIG domain-containing protein [Candidatus Omnitrophica bacterium]|nr:IPT/TIG domain-containing protein [Candidatus Omnitrophota bacterium]